MGGHETAKKRLDCKKKKKGRREKVVVAIKWLPAHAHAIER